jgi:peptide/nickel transport system permease protein
MSTHQVSINPSNGKAENKKHFRNSTLGKVVTNPQGVILLCFVVILCVVSLVPQWFAPENPFEINTKIRLHRPSGTHLFGTDRLGRDLFSRVIHGTRYSIGASIAVVFASMLIGTCVGTVAGWRGRLTEKILMRIVDLLLAFPIIILAMAFIAALGPGIKNAMFALVLVWWGQYARLTWAQVLKVKAEPYIEASIAAGAGGMKIIWNHILPNINFVILVKMTLDIGAAILVIGSLSFIGFGATPPLPEWGLMVVEARSYLMDFWWYPVIPGLAIFLTVIAFNLLGDLLRDILDPKLRSVT